jgi:hypothetical protein
MRTGAHHIYGAHRDTGRLTRKIHRPKEPGMATTTVGEERAAARNPGGYIDGSGWVLFAGIMILTVAVLNIIWGIAAIGNSSFFVQDTRYILSELNTWGWIVLIIGALQLAAAFSIWAGGTFGRWFGIAVASVNAIAALLSVPAYPVWALVIVALDVLAIYGLAVYGGDRRITVAG